MTATEVVIPTLWDYLGTYLDSLEVWIGIVGVIVSSVAVIKWYRGRRGWA